MNQTIMKATAGVLTLIGYTVPRAAAISWNTDASGAWTTPSNWSGGTVPGAGDDVTINRPSANPTVTLSGGGTQAVANLANEETVNISGTNLTVGTPGVAGVVTGNGAISVDPSSALTVNGLSQQQLAVNFGAQVVVRPETAGQSGAVYLRALSIGPAAFLDLKDNDLIIDYAGPSPFDAVHSLVQAGSFGGFDLS